MNEEKTAEQKRTKLTEWVPVWCCVLYALGVLTGTASAVAAGNTVFADWFHGTVGYGVRTTMAYLTSWIPFSLAEFLLLSSPFLVALVVILTVRASKKRKSGLVRSLCAVLALGTAVYILFAVSLQIGYRTTKLEDRLGLERHDITADELYDTAIRVVAELNEAAESVSVTSFGSVNPLSHEESVAAFTKAYGKLAEEYDFLPNPRVPVKRLLLSRYMTYTHLAGLYTFFTGEANLNSNYPYYVDAFSTAHEMAHQRGIIREDEANFIAYLVCISSDEPYLRYAGYLNMYEYFASALFEADPTLYGKIYRLLDGKAKCDLECYGEFFEQYSDNTAADVTDKVNDTYLTSQGTEGVRSYGMVVDLAVAYYEAAKKN